MQTHPHHKPQCAKKAAHIHKLKQKHTHTHIHTQRNTRKHKRKRHKEVALWSHTLKSHPFNPSLPDTPPHGNAEGNEPRRDAGYWASSSGLLGSWDTYVGHAPECDEEGSATLGNYSHSRKMLIRMYTCTLYKHTNTCACT